MTDLLTAIWALRIHLTILATAVWIIARVLRHADAELQRRIDAVLAETDADWEAALTHDEERRRVAWQRTEAAAGMEPTPIHDLLAAQVLRAELDDDAAVGRWLA